MFFRVSDGSGNPFLHDRSEMQKRLQRTARAEGNAQNNQTNQANAIPIIIIEILATLNLWPSLLSKMIVDEM